MLSLSFRIAKVITWTTDGILMLNCFITSWRLPCSAFIILQASSAMSHCVPGFKAVMANSVLFIFTTVGVSFMTLASFSIDSTVTFSFFIENINKKGGRTTYRPKFILKLHYYCPIKPYLRLSITKFHGLLFPQSGNDSFKFSFRNNSKRCFYSRINSDRPCVSSSCNLQFPGACLKSSND